MTDTCEPPVEELFEVPKIPRDEVIQCSFAKWYPQFVKVTPLSFIVELPDEFIKYLISDETIRLPGKLYEWRRDENSDDSESDTWSEIEDEDELNEGDTAVPKFDELSRRVMKKIRKLGGRCFPKLDWSSPKDASWIAINRTLSCSTLIDICLLFKSSTFITHDLTEPFEYCLPEEKNSPNSAGTQFQHNMILRKWVEIDPSVEFRCFVKNRKLVGISQRETTQVHAYISEQRDQIIQDVISFFNEYIENRFPLNNYTFDIFRSKKDYVRLLDFNPFCAQTDSLLFEWKELHEIDSESSVIFRFHESGGGIRPGSFVNYSLPVDVISFANASRADQLIDLMRIQNAQKNQQSSSEDEEEEGIET